MSPLVCPLEGAIVSQMSLPSAHEFSCAPSTLAGTLASYEPAWRAVAAPEWVMRTVTQGYRLQFVRKPPLFNGILFSHTEENSAHILKEEISSLLIKGAIQAEVSAFRISEHMLRIHSSSFRSLSQPSDVLSVHGGGSRPSKNVRSTDFDIHRRLAHHSRVERESAAGNPPCALSYHVPGFQSECEQKQFHTQSECDFSGVGTELSLHASASFSGAHPRFNELCVTVQRGGESAVSFMPQTTGSYGFSYSGFAPGSPENETVHEMGFITTFQPVTRSLSRGNGDAHLFGSSAPLEERRLLRTRHPLGDSYVAESRDDRCVLNGLGCNPGGQNGERAVAEQSPFSTHKLFRAPHHMESSESFSAAPAGTSCSRTLRQYHSGGIHQSPGRYALLKTSQSSSQAVSVEQGVFSVTTRNACSGHSEQRRGSSVKGKPSLRRLASPPASGGRDMEAIRTGNRRSVRLARKCPLSYVLLAKGLGRAPRGGRTGPPMAQGVAVCFPPSVPHNSHAGQSEGGELVSPSDSAQMAQSPVVGRNNSSAICPAVAPPPPHRPVVSSERGNLSPTPGQGGSLGLARERTNLNALGLHPRVIATIQNARAVSTRSLYGCKWQVFEGWCNEHDLISYQCSVPEILRFLQNLMDKGRSFSTIKVYLAAISACHVGFDGSTVGQHPLICRFMKGARRSLPVIRKCVPEWDLSMVLDALSQYPFEPLGVISLKLLSFKVALLLALTSAKRVSELHAFSVHPSCTKFSLNGEKVFLKPNPAFMPKCFPAFTSEVLELSAFHPPPFSSTEDQRLNALCPVRALQTYIDRTRVFRKSDQLFISWTPPHRGNPVSKQRLSHWLVDAIALAYESKGVQPPGNIRAHSTRGVATSWALFRGVSLQDICSAASWASPHTFVRYYRLDVTKTSVAHSVLGVGST
ncbi:uncharacterized protein [Paramisgurnus dabryanus]|uniref:uncharacterized protein n=1 Tax=Paramisgurnus dabryanus TaxID=90735 RepID=UPI003CCF9F8E